MSVSSEELAKCAEKHNLDLITYKKLCFNKFLSEEEKETIINNFKFSDSNSSEETSKKLSKYIKCKCKCQVCEEKFKTIKQLNSHLKAKHPGIRFKCELCKEYFISNRMYTSHKHKIHKIDSDM